MSRLASGPPQPILRFTIPGFRFMTVFLPRFSFRLLLGVLCGTLLLLVAGDGGGSKIAFHTDRDGHDEVYTISADGPGTPGPPDGRPRL